jgi:hypothetical protein
MFSVGLIAFGSLIGAARAADPFYAGKTIHFIVGYAPGGGSDVMCRVMADHMSKHIAGAPTIVVQNMEGAGGANAINYVSEVARPDGLTALCGTVDTLLQLLKDPALRVDINQFQWIFGVPDAQVTYVRADVRPGLKQPADLFKATGLVLGGFALTNSKDLEERLALDLLGVKYQYVTGFNGEGAARAAVQQSFINTWTDAVSSYVSVDVPTLVKPGIVVPVFQSGMPDENGELTKPSAAVPDVPSLYEFYRQQFGKPPSGVQWDTFEAVQGVFAVAQRGIALASNAPPEAVAALRASASPLLQDQQFMTDATNVMGAGFSVYEGGRVQQAFAKGLNPSPAVLQYLIDLSKKAP